VLSSQSLPKPAEDGHFFLPSFGQPASADFRADNIDLHFPLILVGYPAHAPWVPAFAQNYYKY